MQLSTNLSKPKYWRIVLVLASKDILEAIKNKTTLTMLFGLLVMILSVQALPLLLGLDSRPRVAIYDAARTSVADVLRRERTVQVMEMRNEADAISSASAASDPLIAVVLPASWEETAGPIAATGYIGHWIRPAAAADLALQAETALGSVIGRTVHIQTQTVYASKETGGHAVMVALGLAIAILLTSAILVPYLFLEERTAHTLDVLRVSPATVAQIVLGKSLAGMVYGVSAATILLAFNLTMVHFWPLAIVTVLLGALTGTAFGLWAGVLIENEGTIQLWVGLLAVALLFPMMLVFVGGGGIPEWGQWLLSWLPSTAMFELFMISFGNSWQSGQIAFHLVTLVLWAAGVLMISAWRLSRWES